MKRFAITTAGVVLALGMATGPAAAAAWEVPSRGNTDQITDLLGKLLEGTSLLNGVNGV
ncbi:MULTISPECIES: hypothetical protein [unclassified Nonomuraea]|uniref:hypothetical protein n=1 Tax=Nonomuraea sp. NPDC003804 TaxID=3154547 RepID=UPI0033A32E1F